MKRFDQSEMEGILKFQDSQLRRNGFRHYRKIENIWALYFGIIKLFVEFLFELNSEQNEMPSWIGLSVLLFLERISVRYRTNIRRGTDNWTLISTISPISARISVERTVWPGFLTQAALHFACPTTQEDDRWIFKTLFPHFFHLIEIELTFTIMILTPHIF